MPNQHVVPFKGHWAIRPAGGVRVSKRTPTQAEAIRRARAIARRQRCELFVHGRNGRIRVRDTFGHEIRTSARNSKAAFLMPLPTSTSRQTAVSGGGCGRKPLMFLHATVQGLPISAPPLIATADLQGRMQRGESADGLLGCWLASHIGAIHRAKALPDPAESIALLAGDFYTVPGADKRGGTGEVSEVWRRLSQSFRAVTGVAGNHDLFADGRPTACLDGQWIEIGGMRIGGVSGIVGNPQKPNRHAPDQFISHLARVVARQPHVLILHSAPHVDSECPGDRQIAEALVKLGYDGLILCGHVPWSVRVRNLGSATILNVHEAVVCVVPDLHGRHR